jgi:hypothetical protein
LIRQGHESISHAANGTHVTGVHGIVLYVTPQTDDKVVNSASVGVLVQVPDFLEHFLARYGLALILD